MKIVAKVLVLCASFSANFWQFVITKVLFLYFFPIITNYFKCSKTLVHTAQQSATIIKCYHMTSEVPFILHCISVVVSYSAGITTRI